MASSRSSALRAASSSCWPARASSSLCRRPADGLTRGAGRGSPRPSPGRSAGPRARGRRGPGRWARCAALRRPVNHSSATMLETRAGDQERDGAVAAAGSRRRQNSSAAPANMAQATYSLTILKGVSPCAVRRDGKISPPVDTGQDQAVRLQVGGQHGQHPDPAADDERRRKERGGPMSRVSATQTCVGGSAEWVMMPSPG